METYPVNKPLAGKNLLITGAARRIGRHLALTVAQAGANVIVHHAHSAEEAQEVCAQIRLLGVDAHVHNGRFKRPGAGQFSGICSLLLWPVKYGR